MAMFIAKETISDKISMFNIFNELYYISQIMGVIKVTMPYPLKSKLRYIYHFV
jgi:hypothetical protein